MIPPELGKGLSSLQRARLLPNGFLAEMGSARWGRIPQELPTCFFSTVRCRVLGELQEK